MADRDCRLELRMTKDEKNFLNEIAQKKGITKSEILRKLLKSKVIIINGFDNDQMKQLWNNITRDGNMQMKALTDIEYIEKAIKDNERFVETSEVIFALYRLKMSVESLQKDLVETRKFLLEIKRTID